MHHFTAKNVFVPLAMAALLSACAGAPDQEHDSAHISDSQVTLNIPEPQSLSNCDCEALVDVNENYFDRGVRALAARDYDQASDYFQRHRKEGSEEAQREADVGIAFVTLMSEAVSSSGTSDSSGVDERAEVMILALAAVQTLEGRIQALDTLNKGLSKDLEKREEALKRLRDLTLGQSES